MKAYIKPILFSLLALFCVSFNPAYAESDIDLTEPATKTKSSSGFFSLRTDINFLPLESLELETGYTSLAFGRQKGQHSFALGGAWLPSNGHVGIIGDYQYDLSTNSIRPGLEFSLFLGIGMDKGRLIETEQERLEGDTVTRTYTEKTPYLAGGASGGAFVKMDISSKWLIITRAGVRLKPFTVKNSYSLEDSFLVYLGIETRFWLF